MTPSADLAIPLIAIVHRISHRTNVAIVSIQSNSSKFFLLFADWLFTTTTFIPWDILWAMFIAHCGVDVELRPIVRRRKKRIFVKSDVQQLCCAHMQRKG